MGDLCQISSHRIVKPQLCNTSQTEEGFHWRVKRQSTDKEARVRIGVCKQGRGCKTESAGTKGQSGSEGRAERESSCKEEARAGESSSGQEEACGGQDEEAAR